jgi:hypothetical protein
MSVSQWPDKMQVLVFESTSTQALAAFVVPEFTQLKYIPLWLRKVGTAGGSERLRLKVCGHPDLSASLATSDWVTVSTLEAMATQWLGWARFDFARQNLYVGRRYYLAIETDSYTRNGTTFYIGAPLELRSPPYANFGEPAPNFVIMGYK